MFRYLPDPPHETLLWRGTTVQFGSFTVRPDDPEFETAGEIRSHPTVVFPRGDAMWIEQDGHQPFVADRGCVVLYNLHQGYRRRSPTGHGDRADFFHFHEGVLLEAAKHGAASRSVAGERPFTSPRLAVDDVTFALERAVVRHVREEARPDALLVEETLLDVLQRMFRSPSDLRGREGAITARHRELVEDARALLAASATEGHRLDDLAGELGCSVFHLCRTFRAATGTTLHAHRLRLRLRASLERVASPGGGLSAIAYDLGFSNHSHFTCCFRRAFGLTPSALRRRATPELVRGLAGRISEGRP